MTAEEKLAADVQRLLEKSGPIRAVKMFGGVGFMLNGNMVAAVSKRGLLLRVGKDRHGAALAKPGVRAMEMRGRPMEGYVYVDPAALAEGALKTWLGEASKFVQTLPSKPGAGKATKKAKAKVKPKGKRT